MVEGRRKAGWVREGAVRLEKKGKTNNKKDVEVDEQIQSRRTGADDGEQHPPLGHKA
jgi:hypothetical protein